MYLPPLSSLTIVPARSTWAQTDEHWGANHGIALLSQVSNVPWSEHVLALGGWCQPLSRPQSMIAACSAPLGLLLSKVIRQAGPGETSCTRRWVAVNAWWHYYKTPMTSDATKPGEHLHWRRQETHFRAYDWSKLKLMGEFSSILPICSVKGNPPHNSSKDCNDTAVQGRCMKEYHGHSAAAALAFLRLTRWLNCWSARVLSFAASSRLNVARIVLPETLSIAAASVIWKSASSSSSTQKAPPAASSRDNKLK